MLESPELLLLRHGIAEERGADRPDADRALTTYGQRRTLAVVRRLVALNLHFDRLLTSPFTRAWQTAELAVAAGLAPAMYLADQLAPGADPYPLLRWPERSGRLALVGHEPDLSDLAAAVIGAPAGSLVLKKAGAVLLQIQASGPRPHGRLRLLMGPGQLLASN